MPPALMEPNEAFQVTALSVAVPCTVAVNWSVPPVVAEGEDGEIMTEVTTGFGGVTVTVAAADLLVSATLVAVTVSVPGLAGAV